jgi:hypothetical protein
MSTARAGGSAAEEIAGAKPAVIATIVSQRAARQ